MMYDGGKNDLYRGSEELLLLPLKKINFSICRVCKPQTLIDSGNMLKICLGNNNDIVDGQDSWKTVSNIYMCICVVEDYHLNF
jgi:hypothetical protein